MTNGSPHSLLKHIRKLVAAQTLRDRSDRELLDCFVAGQDEAAFAALVERHSAMTLGVCRRVLRRVQDAEDACQAVFLVLARKAGSIHKKESLPSWLHGVAFRIASDLKRRLTRRQTGSAGVDAIAEGDPVSDVTWREAQATLDEELNRLAECYRVPLVLCYLEGKARDEAAQELGWTERTLRSRLERGRELLRARLVRRGFGPAIGLLGAVFAETAGAGMPPTLALKTVGAAALVAMGQEVPASVLSTNVLSLAKGVLQTMFLTKMKTVTCFFLAVAVLGLAVGQFLPSWGHAQGTADLPGASESDVGAGAKADPAEQRRRKYELTAAAAALEAAKADLEIAKARLSAAQAQFEVAKLRLGAAAGKPEVRKTAVAALKDIQGRFFGNIEAVNVKERTISVLEPKVHGIGGDGKVVSSTPRTLLENLSVGDAKITVNGAAGKLADLKKGMHVVLHLEVRGQLVVSKIEARTMDAD